MDIGNALRELRLFKGQGAWRFVMAWLLVLARISAMPMVLIATVAALWLAQSPAGSLLAELWMAIVRAIRQPSW